MKKIAKKQYRNVVVFLFFKEGKVLVEKRLQDELDILVNQLIFPGGTMAQEDTDLDFTFKRELREELGITPIDFLALETEHIIGVNEDVILKPFFIKTWEGKLPEKILDEDDPLEWVELEIMLDSPLKPTQKIARLLKDYLENV